MTSSQPTQPLTDAELEDIRNWHNKTRDRRVGALLGELDRLRIQAVRHIDCNADAWAAAARVTRDLRAELDSMTQFAESLRAERDRSVRSCGELGVELDRLRAENTAQAAKLAAITKDFGADLASEDAAHEDRHRRWSVSDDRRAVETEALRMWPEKIYMGKWDGIMVSPENALAGQRNAFEMGARFQHELLRKQLRSALGLDQDGNSNG